MNGTLRALLAVFVVMYAADARAQATAQINGTVSDSSGDVLPGVTVTATHMATGVRREAVTDATGSYSLPLIYGDDLRGLGEGFESFTPRLRPDGTLVPRNGFVGDPVHVSTCVCRSEFHWAGGVRSMASSNCSICSTAPTTARM